METIRCPNCRGAKEVAKLGGVMGTCNTCEGTGKILAQNKPRFSEVNIIYPVNDVIEQVANVDLNEKFEGAILIDEPEPLPIEDKKELVKKFRESTQSNNDDKIESKRVIHKRKKK